MDAKHNFNRLAYFVATVEAGTITAAAVALGISKAVVSKQLQMLEQDVGTSLLSRNTRHMQPTDAGRIFYKDAKSALTLANNAYERVLERDNKPRGTLRITAPVDFGIAFVAPFAARFRETYPEVNIDLQVSDDRVDIIEERYDVAFRVGWLADSSNLARKLLEFEEIPICSPDTFAKARIERPSDLSPLPFVRTKALAGVEEWVFTKGAEKDSMTANIVAEVNNTLAIRAFVTGCLSYTILPDFLLRDELAAGRLKRLVPDWFLRKGGVYTVTPPGRVRSNALQRFLELAHSEFGLRG